MARGSGKPARPDESSGDAADLSPVRVILADSQAIFRVGMRKILAVEDDLRVVAQTEGLGQTLSAVSKYPADVLLFDSRLSPTPAEAVSEVLKRAPSIYVVVLVPEMDEQETVEYLRRGVRGMALRSIAPDLLVRCLRKVADGETWLDNQGLNWVLQAYRSQAAQLTAVAPKGKLSEKELLIIAGVARGMRNKDIAQEIGTTEQVIKNYLRKIYDKLGVADRLELALYCVHHRLLEGRGRQVSAPADQPEPAVEDAAPPPAPTVVSIRSR
jgi:DNA-binding NarL/FixJ family response regulator